MTGRYEAELNRIRSMEDWQIPKAAVLKSALDSLHDAISVVRSSSAWKGQTTDAVNAALGDIQKQIQTIADSVQAIDSAVTQANNARRAASDAELPSATVDPFWANAAKGASFVVHPVLGPLAADKALDVIGSFLGNQREAEAERVVKSIEQSLVPPRESVQESRKALNEVTFRNLDGEHKAPTDGGSDPGVNAPRISYPGGGTSPSSVPGGGYQPPTAIGTPVYPDGPGDTGGIDPAYPTYPIDPVDPEWPDGPDGDLGPEGPIDTDDPTIDSPDGGILPGGPGGVGGGYPTGPGGSGTGGLPGGLLPGGGGTGGGIGGFIGGGAGAAAIAASSKIAGFGSMGALGGSGLGGGSSAGLKAGGGLLGNSAFGGARGAGGLGGAPGLGGSSGVGGVGSSGGAGVAGGGAASGSSGGAAAGARPGMGMMGGAGGADEEEKAKRSGLGGPIAPKLEDEEERGPRAKGAQAGSRDDHAG